MKEIPLTKGHVALVDDEDFERGKQYSWTAKKGSKKIFAVRNKYVCGVNITFFLHREILGLKHTNKNTVDFLNGNGLDFRKENLLVISTKDKFKKTIRKIKKSGLLSFIMYFFIHPVYLVNPVYPSNQAPQVKPFKRFKRLEPF